MLRTVLTTFALIAGAQSVSANVIVNGGFDDTTSGWTGTWGQRSAGPAIDTGNYLFFGSSGFSSIEQTYALRPLDNAALGSGLIYTLSGDLFSWRNQNDITTVTASFLDGAAQELGMDSITNTTNYDGFWEADLTAGSPETFLSTSGLVPSATESILITVTGQRTSGSNNDAYADNLSLTLTPTAVPLPATGLLALAAVGALVATRRERA